MSSTSVDARVGGAAAGLAPAAGPEHSTPHRWWVLAVIGLAQLMVVLDATIVNIALPSAQANLGFSSDGRQWVVTGYSLAFGSLLLLGGRLGDLFGRKTTLLIGLVGFAGASAVAGASTSLGMLIAGRAVQGAFGALLAPAALSLLTTTFTDPKERARAFGVFGAIAGAGGGVGLLLGGVLTEYLNWRYTLYVNVAIAVVAFIGAMVLVRRPVMPQRPKLDLFGTILAAGGVFGLVYGFSNAATHPWSNWMCWAFLAASAVLLLVFALWERRSGHPLLPLRVLADRNRAASYIAVFVVGTGIFAILLFLTYYLQETLHYSPVRNGLAFLPMIGMMVVFAQLSLNVLVPRLGGKLVVPVGTALAAGGMIYLTRLDLTSTYAGHVLPAVLLIGAGVGMVMPTAMSLATLGVAPHDQGVASAMVSTMQQVGGSIGTALFSTLAATAATNYIKGHQPTTRLTLAHAALHGYATVFWWAAGFFAAALLIALLLYRAGSPMRQMRAAQQAAVAEEAIAAGQPVPGLEGAADGNGATATLSRDGLAAAGSASVSGRVVGPTAVADAPVPAGPPVHRHVGRHAAGSASVSGRVVGPTADADAPVPAGPSVYGHVCRPGGAPLAGATVTLIDPAGRQAGRDSTGPDGSYRISVPGQGTYTLIAMAGGHQPQASALRVGGQPVEVDVLLPGASRLTGTVRAAGTGSPLDGVTISLADLRGEVVAADSTGETGQYLIEDLAPGRYTLALSAPSCQPAALQVVVADGEETTQDAELRSGARVEGTTRTVTGTTVPDARVTLLDTYGNAAAVATTGPDGRYSFENLVEGDYTVIASGYPPTASRLKISSGQPHYHDVQLGHLEA